MRTGRARERRGHGKIPVAEEVVLSRRFVCSKDKRRITGPQSNERHLGKQKRKEKRGKRLPSWSGSVNHCGKAKYCLLIML
ncbi:hypothetical protein NDU88_009629 [Pleurodeles waltl]|uniref:Uncharacterized protein n=1 Tax=Pleurodeles waltl TaxID=8319 RepID=A0AAV7PVF6_PLEWA|nr:hypothetical protein NDU88_009629 [Pleurodeles waltl]